MRIQLGDQKVLKCGIMGVYYGSKLLEIIYRGLFLTKTIQTED